MSYSSWVAAGGPMEVMSVGGVHCPNLQIYVFKDGAMLRIRYTDASVGLSAKIKQDTELCTQLL